MKRTLLTPPLFAALLSSVISAEKPALRAAEEPVDRPKIEVCFALDTTGSMSGLIQAAKAKSGRSPTNSSPPNLRRKSSSA